MIALARWRSIYLLTAYYFLGGIVGCGIICSAVVIRTSFIHSLPPYIKAPTMIINKMIGYLKENYEDEENYEDIQEHTGRLSTLSPR